MKEKLHPDSQDQNQIAKERTLMAWRLFEDLLNSTERTIINTSGKAINDLFNNTPLPLIEGAGKESINDLATIHVAGLFSDAIELEGPERRRIVNKLKELL